MSERINIEKTSTSSWHYSTNKELFMAADCKTLLLVTNPSVFLLSLYLDVILLYLDVIFNEHILNVRHPKRIKLKG